MSGLPKDWVNLKLSDVGKVVCGQSPNKKELNNDGIGMPYISGPDQWHEGKFKIHSWIKFPKSVSPNNSIFITVKGAGVGKIFPGEKACIGRDIYSFVPIKDVNYRFVYFSIMNTVNEIVESAQGIIPGISKSHLTDHGIHLPPLAEQEKIVEKLDQILLRVDACKTRLGCIEKIGNRIASAFFYDDRGLCDQVELKDHCEEGETRIGEKWHGVEKIGVDKEKGIVPLRVGGKKSFEKYKIVNTGDFVYNPMRIDIGSIARYMGKKIAITSPDYVVFRVKKDVSPRLLLRFLKAPIGLAEIECNTQGSVRSRLYYQNLGKIKFPLSSSKKQKEAELILRKFESLKPVVVKLKSQLDLLNQSVLYKAFRGELVSEKSEAMEKTARVTPFIRISIPPISEQYKNGKVLFRELQIAAGLGRSQAVGNEYWIQIDVGHQLKKGMFISQVVGDSMEPTIPDGSYCLFKNPTGQGQVVLLQEREVSDPEGGGKYVIKRLDYETQAIDGVVQRTKPRLLSNNPKYPPRALTEDSDPKIIAEFVKVIK